MFSSFVPETELERTFVQSRNWSPGVLWRRSVLNLDRKQWAVAAALILRYAQHPCRSDDYEKQLETVETIAEMLERLTEAEKHSLFKATAAVVAELFEEGLTIDEGPVLVFLQLLLDVITGSHQICIGYIDMFHRLQLLYQRPLWPSDLLYLRHCCGKQLSDMVARNRSGAMPWRTMEKDDREKQKVVQNPKPANAGTKSGGAPSDAAPSPGPVEERRWFLLEKLAAAKENFGFKSPEVSEALVKFIEFHIEHREECSVLMFLNQLMCLRGQLSGDQSNYQLRAIYSVGDQIGDRQGFQLLAEECERAVLVRRLRITGFDANCTAAVVRLIRLWQVLGKLKPGRTFCTNVFQQHQKPLPEHEFIMACFNFIDAAIKNSAATFRTTYYRVSAKFDLCDEYVASLTVIALQQWHRQRADQSSSCLQELTNFYKDCSGDLSGRVAQMFLLLRETELAGVPDFAKVVNGLSAETVALSPPAADKEPREKSIRTTFHRSSPRARISSADQLRLIKIVEICSSHNAIPEAVTALQLAFKSCTSEDLRPDLERLTTHLLGRMINEGMFEEAALIARSSRIRNIDCAAHKVKIASGCIKDGALFNGASMLFEAFAETEVHRQVP